MPATVREAREADLPRIVELLAQLSFDAEQHERPHSPEAYLDVFREIAADPRQQLLVAEADGRVVGSLVLVIIANLSRRAKPYAIVENVIVDEAARGGGIGEVMLHHAIEEARRAGCYKLSLTSNKRRGDAHRFYERVGLTPSHEGFRYYFD